MINLWAQENERVTIESSEEEVEEDSFATLLDAYNRIIRADEEKLTLLKIDLLAPFFYALSRGGNEETEKLASDVLRVTYEQKYRRDWSWFARAKLLAIRRRLTDYNLSGGIRYYYNLNSRILKGRSANNFSANYLGVEPNLRYNSWGGESGISVKLLYGIQRRIGGKGYFDFDIGLEQVIVPYTDNGSGIDVTVSVGMGLAF